MANLSPWNGFAAANAGIQKLLTTDPLGTARANIQKLMKGPSAQYEPLASRAALTPQVLVKTVPVQPAITGGKPSSNSLISGVLVAKVAALGSQMGVGSSNASGVSSTGNASLMNTPAAQVHGGMDG